MGTNTLPCGCAVATDPASGVLRSVAKCPAHRARMRDPATLDGGYYRELGVIDGEGRLRETRHVAELVEALGELPKGDPDKVGLALEVGCGASPYVGAIESAGWEYLGIDLSPWAAGFTAETWGVTTLAAGLEVVRDSPGFILCAHAFEHMEDAPGAIRKCAAMLAAGGELWLIVPDDSDLTNPDHVWYFTEATLRACLESAGLEVARLASYRRVAHERFIYARARKP